jgi:hypothetical protein
VSLTARNSKTRNRLRITGFCAATKSSLEALDLSNALQHGTNYSLDNPRAKILHNWGFHFTLWLPGSLKPVARSAAYGVDQSTLAMVAILAKATPRQSHIIIEILKAHVKTKSYTGALTKEWVLELVESVYEAAGLKPNYGDGQ